jgi:tetratricopeptide (TPR) repeat protein
LEGERYARESVIGFAETADHWGEGWSLILLGNCIREGQPAKAEAYFRRGLAVCQESEDQSVRAYLSYNLGNILRKLGHYTQAQQYIDQGVRISEELQNFLGLGYALFYRGQLEVTQGKYEQAIRTLNQCITYFNDVGTIHVSRAQVYCGMAFQLTGDYVHAAQLYAQALEGFNLAESRLGFADCLKSLGSLARDEGNLHEAEGYHREALAIWQDMGMEAGVAATLHGLGRVLLALGKARHAEAVQHFRSVLELAARHQLAPIALAACVDMAELKLQTGNVEGAINLLTLAEHHEASTFETRKRARQLLEQTSSSMPDAHSQELWEIVQQLLAEDSAPSPFAL